MDEGTEKSSRMNGMNSLTNAVVFSPHPPYLLPFPPSSGLIIFRHNDALYLVLYLGSEELLQSYTSIIP